MQDQRQIDQLADSTQPVKIEPWFALVEAMCCADSDGKRVTAASVDEFYCGLRIGHAGLINFKIILLAADAAKLSLY